MELNQDLLNGLMKKASENERLRASYDLRTSSDEGSQRMLNALMPGTVVPIHRHPATIETVIIVIGSVTEVFYDDNGRETDRFCLDASQGIYGIQIPKGQWHTVEVTRPCVIMEIKGGKYAPASPEDIMNR